MKKLISLLLVLSMAFAFVGCSQTKPDASETTKAEATTVQQTQYPLTVTDQLNRKVTIESEPKTLVSGYYISTSIIIALGLEDKMVGIEAKAGKRNIYKLSAPQLIDLPNVGTAKEFDLEGCAALNPDLVILPAKLKNVIPSLEQLGITVLAVNPENDDLLVEAVKFIAAATNTNEAATKLIDRITKLEADLTTEISASSSMPTVYLASNSSILSTASKGMYQNSLIEKAGGVNVAAEIDDSYWSDVSYEQIVKWNPEYIILAAESEYTVESVLNDIALKDVDAVKNGKVYKMPNDIEAWDSPVPSCILGSLWLASVIHSDLYSTDDYKTAVIDFYEAFYGFTPEKISD